MFFQKFLFWALYGIPDVLNGRKPACLELFGLRIGKGKGETMDGGILGIAGLFLDPGFRSVNSGSSLSHIPDHMR